MAIASFPEFHVTGPVHHYVRPSGDANIYYLGTAETTPKVSVKRLRKDVFNDIAGREIPMQRLRQGQLAVIGVLLNRFSKDAETSIQVAYPVGEAELDIDLGQESRWSRGSLVFGQSSIELWQVFENYFGPFATTGLEIGRYWPNVDVEELNIEGAGTEEEKIMLVATAFPYWVPQVSPDSVSGEERSWILFSSDDNSEDFPDDVRVPQ